MGIKCWFFHKWSKWVISNIEIGEHYSFTKTRECERCDLHQGTNVTKVRKLS